MKKKVYSFMLLTASVVLLAVDVTYFCTNRLVLTQLNASSSTDSSSTDSSSTDSSSTNSSSTGSNSSASNSNTKCQRETITGQGLYVTSVSGNASATVSLGMRISSELAAQLSGKITAQMKNEYKIICYPNGGCPCTDMDWHPCETSGCPKAGVVK